MTALAIAVYTGAAMATFAAAMRAPDRQHSTTLEAVVASVTAGLMWPVTLALYLRVAHLRRQAVPNSKES